jgi:HPt (histidine-containing phosphotransfer) domain-containing protein
MRDDEKLQQQIADIGTRYLRRTLGELTQLRECLLSVRAQSPDALKQLERMAHKIHGSGAMFGFDAVSERANDIEQLAASGQGDAATLDRLDELLRALTEEVVKEARARGVE